MKRTIACVECARRKIVVVKVPGWGRQAFYQSSGANSGKPDKWFPFDGIVPGWFVKDRFGGFKDPEHRLYRYGYECLAEVGDWLATQEFLVKEIYDHREDLRLINEYIDTAGTVRPPLKSRETE